MDEERKRKKRQQGEKDKQAQDRDGARRKLLGANMRTARLQLGFTQEHVAELLGISTEVYGRMERGTIFPRMERFMDLCEKLSVPPDRLLGYASGEPPATGVPQPEQWSTVLHRFMPVSQKLTRPQLLSLRRYLVDLNRLLTGFVEQSAEQPQGGSPSTTQPHE
jgi:transcriptional regulator with XRE-family HTH domain